MRTAIVSEYYYPLLGGITEHVHGFACEATRRGHAVTIITSCVPGGDGVTLPPGVRLLRIGRGVPAYSNGSFARVTWGVGVARQLRAFFERERFDVVHVHSPTVPVLPLLAQCAGD